MDTAYAQEVERQNNARKEAEVQRRAALLQEDFSVKQDFNQFYDALSVSDIKHLHNGSQSFRDRVKLMDAQGSQAEDAALITKFRGMSENDRQGFLGSLSPYQRQIINDDYDRFMALTPEQQIAEVTSGSGGPIIPTVVLDPEDRIEEQRQLEKEAAAAAQAEADRLAAEAAASPAIVSAEDLYDGIEKLGEGSYKLTIDPEDGTPPEIFYGTSQKECFKALKKSKANATKELRRRKKKIEITNDLKLLGEKVDYSPLVEPLILTPDQIFTMTERQKELKEQLDDPTTVLKATRELNDISEKFKLAALTQEDCDKLNRPEINRRYVDQHNTAARWVKEHPEFYSLDPQNIEEIKNFLIAADWAVTEKNLDLAFKTLKEQDVLSDPPVDEPSSRPMVAQPASVVPVAPVAAIQAPVVTPAPPVVVPTVTAGALPETEKHLRPGSSSSTGMTPTQRIESVSLAQPTVVLTVEMYNAMPAADVKRRYQREPQFKAALDKLMAEGKI